MTQILKHRYLRYSRWWLKITVLSDVIPCSVVEGYSRINSTKSPASAQTTLASLGWCHKSGECANLYARRSLCLCSWRGGGARDNLLTQQLQSCDWGKEAVRLVRFTLKVAMQNDGDFMDVILLYLLYRYTNNWTATVYWRRWLKVVCLLKQLCCVRVTVNTLCCVMTKNISRVQEVPPGHLWWTLQAQRLKTRDILGSPQCRRLSRLPLDSERWFNWCPSPFLPGVYHVSCQESCLWQAVNYTHNI